jgi:hypothetical protein
VEANTVSKYGSELLPEGFFVVDSDVEAFTADSELVEARDIAEANPGQWVRVGYLRHLKKSPSSWCSEVNSPAEGCEKRALLNRGGTFRACHWQETPASESEFAEYGKALMFIPESVR